MAPSPDSVTKSITAAPRARCGQCGKLIRHLPFNLGNLSCRECYGGERYPRSSPSPAPVLPAEPPLTTPNPESE